MLFRIYHNIDDTVTKTEQVKSNIAFYNTPLYGQGLSAAAVNDFSTTLAHFLDVYVQPVSSLYSYCPTVLNNVDNSADTFAIGNTPAKIDRVFQTIDDVDALRIDLSVEAGLGTMYSICQTLSSNITGDQLKDRKSTRLNSSHSQQSRMPSSA